MENKEKNKKVLEDKINNEIQQYKKKNKRKRALPITIILIVTLGLLAFFLMNNDDFLDYFKETDDYKIKDSEIVVNKDFLNGLRLSSIDRYDEAISYFEKLKFNDLSESDQEVILGTYLKNDDEQKALDLNTDIDKEVIKKYLANDDMDKLKELKTDSKEIEFEVAILQNDYEKIIELNDEEEFEIDARRGNFIANAYYQLGERKQAIEFTSLMALDGVNLWVEDSKVSNSEINPNSTKSKSSSNIGFWIAAIVIVLTLGVISFFYVKNKMNNVKVEDKEREPKKYEQDIKECENNEDKKKNDRYSYYFDE